MHSKKRVNEAAKSQAMQGKIGGVRASKKGVKKFEKKC
jgi:hypothetical protein